jgi:hypothetical protein
MPTASPQRSRDGQWVRLSSRNMFCPATGETRKTVESLFAPEKPAPPPEPAASGQAKDVQADATPPGGRPFTGKLRFCCLDCGPEVQLTADETAAHCDLATAKSRVPPSCKGKHATSLAGYHRWLVGVYSKGRYRLNGHRISRWDERDQPWVRRRYSRTDG